MAAGCCDIGHSPLFTFPAYWTEALLEQLRKTEPDPAFVMFHSQQLSVSPDSRTHTVSQTPGTTRIFISPINNKLPMYLTQISKINQ